MLDFLVSKTLSKFTEECDCMGQAIASNIGVFVSKDPVEIDAACIDMLQKENGISMYVYLRSLKNT